MKIVKIKKDNWFGEEIQFMMENKNYWKSLVYVHDQDCCEEVYADFSVLKNYNLDTKTGQIIDIFNVDFEETIDKLIQPVKDMGINLIAKNGSKFFVPCYNIQNGYYSSDLQLWLIDHLDISNCTQYEEK